MRWRRRGQEPEDDVSQEEEYSPFWYIFSTIILSAAILICTMISVQIAAKGYAQLGGYSLFRVVTGSMEPTIPTGAVLVSEEIDIGQVAQDDIICYKTRIPEIYGAVVTHRVVAAFRGEDGEIYLETKGDANVVSDMYYVRESDLVGRVVWYSGKESVVTNIASFLSGKIGFLACVAFPVLLLVGMLLKGAVGNLRKEIAALQQELERGPKQEAEPEEPPLPGYTTLTQEDYEELYEKLKREIFEEH